MSIVVKTQDHKVARTIKTKGLRFKDLGQKDKVERQSQKAKDQGSQSQAALKEKSSKVAKREKACLENQHVFIPFAFDTFGFLAPETEKFLNRVQRVVQNYVLGLCVPYLFCFSGETSEDKEVKMRA
nr:auxilin-like protein [Tanacetum cinerariifolium]